MQSCTLFNNQTNVLHKGKRIASTLFWCTSSNFILLPIKLLCMNIRTIASLRAPSSGQILPILRMVEIIGMAQLILLFLYGFSLSRYDKLRECTFVS